MFKDSDEFSNHSPLDVAQPLSPPLQTHLRLPIHTLSPRTTFMCVYSTTPLSL